MSTDDQPTTSKKRNRDSSDTDEPQSPKKGAKKAKGSKESTEDAADKEAQRKEREKKTKEFAKRIKVSNKKVNPATFTKNPIKVKDLNVADISIGLKSSKPSADNAMYFFDHLYKGEKGPVIEIKGRLRDTPTLSQHDAVNYGIEIADPATQKKFFEWDKKVEMSIRANAVKAPFWKQMGENKKLVESYKWKPFVFKSNAKDPEMFKIYSMPDSLPDDLIDPASGKEIVCWPPKFKATLMTDKKIKEPTTKAYDKDGETEINPISDFKAGNLVKMMVSMSYGYYKAMSNSKEFGIPTKLVKIIRLDQQEAKGSGKKFEAYGFNQDSEEEEGNKKEAESETRKKPTLFTAATVTALNEAPKADEVKEVKPKEDKEAAMKELQANREIGRAHV